MYYHILARIAPYNTRWPVFRNPFKKNTHNICNFYLLYLKICRMLSFSTARSEHTLKCDNSHSNVSFCLVSHWPSSLVCWCCAYFRFGWFSQSPCESRWVRVFGYFASSLSISRQLRIDNRSIISSSSSLNSRLSHPIQRSSYQVRPTQERIILFTLDEGRGVCVARFLLLVSACVLHTICLFLRN